MQALEVKMDRSSLIGDRLDPDWQPHTVLCVVRRVHWCDDPASRVRFLGLPPPYNGERRRGDTQAKRQARNGFVIARAAE